MTDLDGAALGALNDLSRRTSVTLTTDGDTVIVDGTPLDLPILIGEQAQLFGIEGLFPTVPRGDDRDKLLWKVVAEARSDGYSESELIPDRRLDRQLEERLNLGAEASRAAATVLRERFFNHKTVPVLLPVHGSLPLNYRHSTKKGVPSRYRMFNGAILPFLLWTADGDVDAEPLRRLIEVIADDTHFTALDRRFMEVASEEAPYPDASLDADALIEKYRSSLGRDFRAAGGPFCQASLDAFRQDLRTVLDTKLPRPDMISWLTLLLSLHLALRLYRIATVMGEELDIAVAAAGDLPVPAGSAGCPCDGTSRCLERCALAGRIRFRTGVGRYQPVRSRNPCRASYVELDRGRLLDLPATLVTRNLACRAWQALGGGPEAGRRDMTALAAALAADPELRHRHGAACAAIAILHHKAWRPGAVQAELEGVSAINASRPGLHALREDVRRMRARDLRHQSQDIVNQLMLDVNVAGPGSLIARNGTFGFFELDEQLLLLLVRIICRDDQLPYQSFLERLSGYGLAPQDEAERAALQATLERLGLLLRYSDAGEAAFVHFA